MRTASVRLSTLVLLSLCVGGCSLPFGPPKSQTRDKAYIEYWPPDETSGRLRLAVKDNIDMKGTVTTAGSLHFAEKGEVATRDAKLLRGARRDDVVIVGKTTLTEFALGTAGVNEHYGAPINPLQWSRIPGGSSSGSAVAVANGTADVAFGSDTAGSIRVPAACCGIFGLKTTFGLIPLDGVSPLSPTNLDTVGPMAADVPRLVKGMELLDSRFPAQYRKAMAKFPTGRSIRVGRLFVDGTDREIDRAIDRALELTGFEVVPLPKSFQDAWVEAQANGMEIAMTDGWLTHRDYIGKAGVGMTTSTAIRFGAIGYPEDYQQALAKRARWRHTLDRVLRDVDLIALPTLKKFPPRKPLLFRRTAFLEARVLALQNTVAVNYAGNPAIAIPIHLPGMGFPVTSLQLIGARFGEAELMNAARLVEKRGSAPDGTQGTHAGISGR